MRICGWRKPRCICQQEKCLLTEWLFVYENYSLTKTCQYMQWLNALAFYIAFSADTLNTERSDPHFRNNFTLLPPSGGSRGGGLGPLILGKNITEGRKARRGIKPRTPLAQGLDLQLPRRVVSLILFVTAAL